MELQHMKEFIVLAETQNYLEAADALYIAQSSLSKHIMAMEKELKVALFDRTTRKVKLSAYGETFLPYAKDIIQLQYQYTTALFNQSAHQKETLSIGSIPIMAPYHITNVIMKFRNENEKFAVNLMEGESAQLKTMLVQGKIELAFLREEQDNDDEFIKIPYTSDSMAVVLPKHHPLAKTKNIRLEQLKDEDFLFLQPGSILYSLCMKSCEEVGFTPNVTFTGKRAENIIDLIEKGMGISLLMKKPIQYLANNQIVIVDVVPTITTQVKVYYKKDAQLSNAAKHFIDCVHLTNE